MKTTMVAGERGSGAQGGGSPSPPEEAQPIVPRLLSPAVCRRGGCRRPPAPSLPPSVLIRTGGRMLGQAKPLRRSCC